MSAFMTIKEFMADYPISRSGVYNQIRAEKLRAYKIGGKTVIRRDDAEEWFKSLRQYQPRTAA